MEKHVLITTDGKKLYLDDNQLEELLYDLNKGERLVKYEDTYLENDITRYINVDSIKTIIEYK